jgi:hypothetical protein
VFNFVDKASKSSRTPLVTTLALGSRPRQRVWRWRAKRETQESLPMLLGVQRMWGNEPSHSQVNSHVGSWSPKWTLGSSECNFKGKYSFYGKIIYIIGKLLKHKCLKWAHIAHLDIWNKSYEQKKGRESNWQFDSWPLKVRNWLDFLAWRQRATYHWKFLNEGYNFALDCIVIGGLHRKLCASKATWIPVVGISRLPLGSPGT